MSLNHRPAFPLAAATQILRGVAAIARALLGLVLIAMVVLNVANAVGRYAFKWVLIGADEVLVFGMVWMVMIGMVLVVAQRGHIALDLVTERASPHAKTILALVAHAVMALGCGYATVQSFSFVQRITATEQTSMALGIPMLVPHSALIVGFGGTAIIAAAFVLLELAKLASAAGGRGKARS